MKNFLEEFIDIEKSNVDPQFNLDEPESCDLCGKSFSNQEFFIDGEVKDTNQISLANGQSVGEWAYMCPECFKNRGVAIKWGRGQLYQKTLNNEWLLVGGFPPDES
jgi:hypothetical protein